MRCRCPWCACGPPSGVGGGERARDRSGYLRVGSWWGRRFQGRRAARRPTCRRTCPPTCPGLLRRVPAWMALHPGNPGFGAGRADPDVAVEATGRRSRGCGRRSSASYVSGAVQRQARCPTGTSAEGADRGHRGAGRRTARPRRRGAGCCPTSRRTTRSPTASQGRSPPPLTAAVSGTHSRGELAR
jgi:hypothetical protein